MRSLLFGFGLSGLENRKQMPGVSGGADMAFHEQVHEARDDVRYIEVNGLVVRKQALMSRVIPNPSDGVPEGLFVSREIEAFDSVEQGVACPAEMVDKAFKADSEKHTSRPWRGRGNPLGFFKGLANVVRHVCRGSETATHGPNDCVVFFKNQTAASGATPNAHLFGVYEVAVFHARDAKFSIANAIGSIGHDGATVVEEMVNDWVLSEKSGLSAVRAIHRFSV